MSKKKEQIKAAILNAETKLVDIENLLEHPRNPNRNNELHRIVESIESDGFYGTILVQRETGYIVAGNHRYRAARVAGLKEVPVTYLDVNDETALRILVKDNRIAEFGQRDEEVLGELLNELSGLGGIEGVGFTDEEFADLMAGHGGENGSGRDGDGKDGDGDGVDPNYERKVEAPVYEPKSEVPPPVEVLADETKAKELLDRIEAAEVPDNVRHFLRLAAGRHVVFDYEEIAEFYSHADKETQRLFEDSALVIIDFDAAVENGFVKLVGELAEAYDRDREELNAEADDEDEE